MVEISVENLCIDLKKINRFDDEIEFLKQNVKIIVETKKYIVLWFMARTKNRCRMVATHIRICMCVCVCVCVCVYTMCYIRMIHTYIYKI